MTNQFSIEYISGLLNRPASISAEDKGSVDAFLQAYPYFVPLRYVAAIEKNRDQPFSPEMLSGIQPYLGNWIQFCDIVNAAGTAPEIPVQTPQDVMQEEVTEQAREETLVHEPHSEPEEEAEPVQFEAVAQEPEQVLPHETAPVVLHEAVITEQHPASEEEDAEPPVLQETIVQAQQEDAVTPHVGVSEEFLRMIREEVPGVPLQQEKQTVSMRPHDQNVENEIQEEVVAVAESDPVATVNQSEAEETGEEDRETLIPPIYTQDYFLQQGEKVPEEIPNAIDDLVDTMDDEDRSLMVMMSFSEWLQHFKSTKQKKEEEKKDQRALRTMWQKEKLAAAMEEENEEIPENVFEMAVNSITKEDGLASESLADIYIKQGKYDKAIDMYRKLSLRNPQKNAYFARKIEEVLKEKQS